MVKGPEQRGNFSGNEPQIFEGYVVGQSKDPGKLVIAARKLLLPSAQTESPQAETMPKPDIRHLTPEQQDQLQEWNRTARPNRLPQEIPFPTDFAQRKD